MTTTSAASLPPFPSLYETIDVSSVGSVVRLHTGEPSEWATGAVLSNPHILTNWKDPTLVSVRNLRWLTPGWDESDSGPISPIAIGTASNLISALAEAMPNLPVPAITPTPYLGIYIEWYSPNRIVAFTVADNGEIELEYEDEGMGLEWEGLLRDAAVTNLYRVLSAYSCEVLHK